MNVPCSSFFKYIHVYLATEAASSHNQTATIKSINKLQEIQNTLISSPELERINFELNKSSRFLRNSKQIFIFSFFRRDTNHIKKFCCLKILGSVNANATTKKIKHWEELGGFWKGVIYIWLSTTLVHSL